VVGKEVVMRDKKLSLATTTIYLYMRSASLRAGLRRKEKDLFLLYPALTRQHVRKERAHAVSTCWATIIHPLRGLEPRHSYITRIV
jgi:hypothetical protein